jgi:hypothetical protein
MIGPSGVEHNATQQAHRNTQEEKEKKEELFTSEHGFQCQRHKEHSFLDCMQDPTKVTIT